MTDETQKDIAATDEQKVENNEPKLEENEP